MDWINSVRPTPHRKKIQGWNNKILNLVVPSFFRNRKSKGKYSAALIERTITKRVHSNAMKKTAMMKIGKSATAL